MRGFVFRTDYREPTPESINTLAWEVTPPTPGLAPEPGPKPVPPGALPANHYKLLVAVFGDEFRQAEQTQEEENRRGISTPDTEAAITINGMIQAIERAREWYAWGNKIRQEEFRKRQAVRHHVSRRRVRPKL